MQDDSILRSENNGMLLARESSQSARYMDILRSDKLTSNMLDFVESLLAPVDNMNKSGHRYPFRSRYAHVERVTEWALRICEEEGGDAGILAVASIFHDAGYHFIGEGHARRSVIVFNEYIEKHRNSFEKGHTKLSALVYSALTSASGLDEIRDIIAIHSDKILANGDISLEAGILMDADILDETGAMAVLFDCYCEADEPKFDYYTTYERISSRFANEGTDTANFHTKAGKRRFNDLRRYTGDFINGLKQELGL